MYTFIVLASLSVISCYVSGNSTTDKSILRYGFQNTQECQDYEKAFLCVQKCQDLNYNSALSDKHCKCTCYSKPELLKHKIKYNTTRNDWKSGAPTTKLPIWAQTTNTDKNNIIDDDDDDHTTDDVSKEIISPNENESSGTHSSENAITTEGQDDNTVDNSSTPASSDVASNSTDANNTVNDETENINATVNTGDTPEADKGDETSNAPNEATAETAVKESETK
ncbi:uncharacterized protein LOC133517784 isoform X2 [Cydia pomonella]|uniref:uncharacterized protein LOC133517784 isoform X2 n=1 Tax=Cydia pomonella TaxID=82600 RepID=UPI002ADDA5FE|nr:uncharacterized protein LOC133517784 isoform X2 [Cydia pomonella]